MDMKKRLFRRPVTTIFWLLAVTAMALLMGVGSALMYSSVGLARTLDQYHTSIAVRTDAARIEVMTEHGLSRQTEEKLFTQEDLDYFLSLDSVEGVYFHTLSAAYSPSFRPLVTNSVSSPTDQSYSQAAVVGEVTKIFGHEPYSSRDDEDTRSRVHGLMKVEQILSQSPNYTRIKDDSLVEELVFEVVLVRQEDAAYIQEGQRYILLAEYDFAFAGARLQDGTEIPKFPRISNNNNTNGAVLTDRGLVKNTRYLTPAPEENPADDQLVMVRLDGSLEDFLTDPANAQWAWFLDSSHKQNLSVPVLGTEAMEFFHIFVNYDATMTQGRFFTQEEYDAGAKVCILNEALAQSSGINLGDTITLSQFLCHENKGSGYLNTAVVGEVDGRLNNPDIGGLTYRDVGPEETFTVVGLYRHKNLWADTSYSVGPNTIFIPQKAQIEGAFGGMSQLDIVSQEGDSYWASLIKQTQRVGGTYGVYFTMKLKNGMVEDFKTAMENSEYRDQFLTVDQGFDAVQKTLDSTASSTRMLFLAVLAGWLLMAALYALLYQGLQRRNIGIMRCLGVSPKLAQNYLWGGGMVVSGIGIILGTIATGATMGLVQDKLLEATFGVEANRYSVAGLSEDAINLMVTESQLPIWATAALGLAQFLILGLILYLQARRMTRKSPRLLLGK